MYMKFIAAVKVRIIGRVTGITIPVKVLKLMGISTGDQVAFMTDGHNVTLVKADTVTITQEKEK